MRGRGVDGRQLGVVDAVQQPLKRGRHAWICEERFRCCAVGCAGGREAVTVPQIAVEVVFEEWSADQTAGSEDHSPEEHEADWERFAATPEIPVKTEDRQAGPGNQNEEHRQVGLTGLFRQEGEAGVTQCAPEADCVHNPPCFGAGWLAPVCCGGHVEHSSISTTVGTARTAPRLLSEHHP